MQINQSWKNFIELNCVPTKSVCDFRRNILLIYFFAGVHELEREWISFEAANDGEKNIETLFIKA